MTNRIEIGDTAPEFTLPADGGTEITLSAFQGQYVVLYFYPKDDTSGCTAQACGFRDSFPDFQGVNTQIIGISKDKPSKHDKFKAKYDLNFPLASDEEGEICDKYGVWVEKSMYGRKYMGVERSTFIINEKGVITHMWRKVKVPGHVETVLKALQETAQAA